MFHVLLNILGKAIEKRPGTVLSLLSTLPKRVLKFNSQRFQKEAYLALF